MPAPTALSALLLLASSPGDPFATKARAEAVRRVRSAYEEAAGNSTEAALAMGVSRMAFMRAVAALELSGWVASRWPARRGVKKRSRAA